MPLNALKKLESRATSLESNFRAVFKDIPTTMTRCETNLAVYQAMRSKIIDLAANLHETKGVVAGLEGAPKILDQFKIIAKQAAEKEEVTVEEAKARIALVDQCQKALMATAAVKKNEFVSNVGTANGIVHAATYALDQIEQSINNHAMHLRTNKGSNLRDIREGKTNSQKMREEKAAKSSKQKKPTKKEQVVKQTLASDPLKDDPKPN